MTEDFEFIHDELDENEGDEYLSRSEKKRRSTARQKIGEDLARMPITAVRSFGLPSALVAAFEEFHKYSKHEAKRRQMQFIGRMLRDIDTAELESRLSDYHAGRASATADFHHLERLRDALMNEQEGALDEMLETYPSADVQYVRQLVRNGRKEIAAGKPSKASRTLFRYLRDIEDEQ
ncbi:MAG: ribosome biogenesis factor YjgA [Halodesulfovibrio sp.]